MDLIGKGQVPAANFCEWCSGVGTSRCGRCHIAYYCCREHQIQHWTIHKKVCKKSPPLDMPGPVILNSPINTNERLDTFPYEGWCQNNLPCAKNDNMQNIMAPNDVYNAASCIVNSEKPLDFQIPNEDEIFSSLSSELLSSDNNFWDVINSQNIFDCSGIVDELSQALGDAASAFQCADDSGQSLNADNGDLMQCASLNDICSNVVHDLNTYGICVLDKFVGSKFGELILQEVKNLYLTGIFKKGELVNPNPYLSKESIRSDVTTWVDGTEPGCKYIGSLIRKLDVVVTTCNKMPNNGLLSEYKLHRRTKAMIACYPGDGTYYKKHVDNPHKDGRCITCIYYLNQNWDTKQHGGLLRMFPAAHDSQVANIEPIFDRMLFFWSDKRNPHEVLPSFATRFAITVWYFDADERDRALMMSRDRALMKSRNQQFMN